MEDADLERDHLKGRVKIFFGSMGEVTVRIDPKFLTSTSQFFVCKLKYFLVMSAIELVSAQLIINKACQ